MSQKIFTVVDADARIRSGPPTFRWRHPRRLPRYTRVRILEESGRYVRVEGLRGRDFGWTFRSNIASFYVSSRGNFGGFSVLTLEMEDRWMQTKRVLVEIRVPGIPRPRRCCPRSKDSPRKRTRAGAGSCCRGMTSDLAASGEGRFIVRGSSTRAGSPKAAEGAACCWDVHRHARRELRNGSKCSRGGSSAFAHG